jgi:hypothetical protein
LAHVGKVECWNPKLHQWMICVMLRLLWELPGSRVRRLFDVLSKRRH